MGLSVRRVKDTEVQACVDMYIVQNDESFLFSDRRYAITNLLLARRQGAYFKVAVDGDEIEGWMMAQVGSNYHFPYRIYEQKYFMSRAKGFRAARVVKILHEDLIAEAMAKNVPVIMSPGSHMDRADLFVTMLERMGWDRREHIAVFKTHLYDEMLSKRLS